MRIRPTTRQRFIRIRGLDPRRDPANRNGMASAAGGRALNEVKVVSAHRAVSVRRVELKAVTVLRAVNVRSMADRAATAVANAEKEVAEGHAVKAAR